MKSEEDVDYLVDRLTHRHDDNQKLGTPHTECRTLGGREGRCWGTEARVGSVGS